MFPGDEEGVAAGALGDEDDGGERRFVGGDGEGGHAGGGVEVEGGAVNDGLGEGAAEAAAGGAGSFRTPYGVLIGSLPRTSEYRWP